MFSGPIFGVQNTNILCAINFNRTRQLIAYSNQVNSIEANNVMILPVPNPETVKFHDLSYYPDLFEDCYKDFQMEYGLGEGMDSFNPYLKIINIGSYVCSLAMNKEEILQIDPGTFEINENLDKLLDDYKDYGFIICKMLENENNYEPLCYSHDVDNNIFIPTRHYHIDTENDLTVKDIEKWEHNIYIHNVDNINKSSLDKEIKYSLSLCEEYEWCHINKRLLNTLGFNLLPDDNNYHRLKIYGQYKNIDLNFYNNIDEYKNNNEYEFSILTEEQMNSIKLTKQNKMKRLFEDFYDY